MKGILIVAFSIFQILNCAEAIAGKSRLFRKPPHLVLAKDTIWPGLRQNYQSAKQMRNVSLSAGIPAGLLLGGSGLYLLNQGSFQYDIFTGESSTDDTWKVGFVLFAAGVAVTFGIAPTLAIIGGKRMRKMRTAYPGLALKPSSTGVGLAVVF